MGDEPSADKPLVIGRYALFEPIASGGMATVYFGRLLGPVGFSRVVAVKRLHEHLARDPEFVSLFLDEARLAARIRHPNVVPTLDVVAMNRELFLVMEYVQGESLSRLLQTLGERGERIPPRIVAGIVSGLLLGLHAAHEAVDERGEPLHLVHRDVSPQNVLVGIDGMARVLDFGIAKAAGRVQTTREGHIKGKIAYMAPEQLRADTLTRAADIYAGGVVLWEALTGMRLFRGESEAQVVARVITGDVRRPSEIAPELAPFDDVVLRSLSPRVDVRYQTARAMATAVEACIGAASAAEVSDWLEHVAGPTLRNRAATLAEIEKSTDSTSEEYLKEQIAAMMRSEHVRAATEQHDVSGRAGLSVRTMPMEVQARGPGSAPSFPSFEEVSQSSNISVSLKAVPMSPPIGKRLIVAGGALGVLAIIVAVGLARFGSVPNTATVVNAGAVDAKREPPPSARPIPPPDAVPTTVAAPTPITPTVTNDAPSPSATSTNAVAATPPATPKPATGTWKPATPTGTSSGKPKSRFDALGGRD